MKILRSIAGIFVIITLIFFSSCNKSSVTTVLGDWTKQAPFEGVPRSGAVSFTIGNKAYVGLGYDGNFYKNDFYVYDVDRLYWDSIAPFPGLGRESAVAFSVNGKGYVGTGFNRDSVARLRDFWEYNPATYKWTQLNNFAGEERQDAVAFDDGTYGYVGTGFNTVFYGDFWQYKPATDTWEKIPSYSGDKRMAASTFTLGGKTYFFGGQNNGSFTYDMWEFDPTLLPGNPWTNKTPLTTDAQYNNFRLAVSRYDAVAFSLNNMGYIATGSNGSILNTCYQYNPADQTYTVMTPFERAARSQAVSFVLQESSGEQKKRAYVTTGSQGTSRFDDMMEFRPLDAYVQNN